MVVLLLQNRSAVALVFHYLNSCVAVFFVFCFVFFLDKAHEIKASVTKSNNCILYCLNKKTNLYLRPLNSNNTSQYLCNFKGGRQNREREP